MWIGDGFSDSLSEQRRNSPNKFEHSLDLDGSSRADVDDALGNDCTDFNCGGRSCRPVVVSLFGVDALSPDCRSGSAQARRAGMELVW